VLKSVGAEGDIGHLRSSK